MCGISAIVNLSRATVPEEILRNATHLIAHRGPDGEGHYSWNHIALGHRRLSIIDLSTDGKQPMHYLDRYVITYNGEIYNYLELKAELENLDYQFTNKTDTEVILAAYHAWGKHAFNRFIGMWAFVILDKEKNELIVCRDRFAVKPIYYTQTENYWAVASEIKQFKALPDFKPTLNQHSAIRFLVYAHLNVDEDTFFNEAKELRGGHLMVMNLENQTQHIEQWYRPELSRTKLRQEEVNRQFKHLLQDSIRLRMRSDVPVGSCLSGGMDSSSIVSMVGDLYEDISNFQTISICSTDKRFDEQEYLDAVIEKVKVKSHKVFLDLDDLFDKDHLAQMVYYQDQPIPSASHYAEYKVYEKAKNLGLTVMLGGQGSDEAWGGYDVFIRIYLKTLVQRFKFEKFCIEVNALKKLGIKSYRKSLKEVLLAFANNFLGGHDKVPAWINKENFKEVMQQVHQFPIGKDLVTESQKQIFKTSIPYQFHSEDRNAMLHSIESRAPFIDHRLIELSFKLGNRHKIYKGKTKVTLRNVMKGILPDKVVYRHSKMAFETPEEVWMRENASIIRPRLQSAIDCSQGILNEHLLKDFDDYVEGHRKYSFGFFRILSFGIFMKTHF